ncbi:MogA/MoaB family molybdenum cofactor biosynthesis protein [Niameybacter massiliensis]|uniref:MogA/MoaB family molybdenum cofactor biosynthesis protein n=1 Tax=Niameybacter massiliensis TaxID=1658108 RepID=UPI0006B4046F|nr:MogA/MoaB family molybdenum cofactor biosynthesis protein [Niameybacter massiliensis]
MIRVGIITASDKGSKGEREDRSGEVIREIVAQQGWEVTDYIVLPDERHELSGKMQEWCDSYKVDLILTTGGTGFSKRDCTPEATLDIVEKQVPGIPEAMRYYSLQITPRAMLSRSVAGIRRDTLIVNLPGSPKAVRENLESIIGSLEHGIGILQGSSSECARPE